MRLTEAKLKKIIKEQLEEAMLTPTFHMNREKGMDLILRILNDPNVNPKIKDMLNSDDESLINQSYELVSALHPEYAEEIDQMNSRQNSFEYSQEFERFYDDAKSMNEGILQQMEAEKILRDEFFRVKELKAQGKATEEELMKAYEDMKNLDTDQFYTPEELSSFEAERAEREQRYQDRLDSEDAEERARNARLGQDRIAALNMRSGYGDRGIDMGPDDPGDVDDLYPELREAKLNPTFFLDIEGRRTFTDRVLADPEVDSKIKTMLKRALDNPKEDWAKADIDQVDMLLRTLYPKYAEELDRYDSHQGSLGYQYEFTDFYKDAKERAMKNPGNLTESKLKNTIKQQLEEIYNVDQVEPDKGSNRLTADAMKGMSEFEKQSGFFKSPSEELVALVARAVAEAPKVNPQDGMKLVQKAKEIGIAKKVYKVVDKIKSGKLTFPQYESMQKKDGGLLYEGDDSVLSLFEDATLEEGGNACGACLFEQLQEASCGCPDLMGEAEYQGRKVTLNKPMRGDVKKFKVYVKDPKTGNVKKVNFGDPNMKIKKSNPKRRKSFRARHNCDNPGPKTKARYWSCKKW